MRIAVMGAGAVGCFFGALLAQAGHEVVLIGRAAHMDAVRANGLLLERAAETEHVRLEASTAADAVAGAGLVLFCVKSDDTEAAGRQMAPHLAADAMVLSLQNGIGNAQRLEAVLHRPVYQAAVYVAVEMAGAGHVRHHGRGELIIGLQPGAEALAGTLRAAEVPVEISAEVEGLLWTKLVLNCAYNALSAITSQPYGALLAVEGAEILIHNILAECEAVARAEGIVLPAGLEQIVLQTGRDMARQFSSTAQDIMRGRRTEIDYLNGYVVRLGAVHGVATPLNQALTVMVKIIEKKI
ncbi:MAG: 2-dehydropantoate 2-reductase [Proteobacteria bacterium]|nr:2-dehydropantoate 2-reductase [Pseudomonadota bacterium]MBU6426253.1 2-dehydropantoate 2-reductase [Rhodospirillales bacterium]